MTTRPGSGDPASGDPASGDPGSTGTGSVGTEPAGTDAPRAPQSVAVIGTGLIGTSVALALREQGTRVWLSDRDPAAARLAADMGAGEVLPAGGLDDGQRADIAVLAVPPAAVAAELAAAQARGLARWYTDVASVKELPLARARELGCDLATFVAGHPLSGRERSGPAAARADLFLGRAWVLCPVPETDPAALTAVTVLAAACGAQPVELAAAEHDRWVALVSHAPQLVAAAMAARLEEAPAGALGLAGQGLRDVTRIAAGDPGLWMQILAANAGPAAGVLALVAEDLHVAAAALTAISATEPAYPTQPAQPDQPDHPTQPHQPSHDEAVKRLTDLLERGGAGVARIPGKRGGPAPHYAVVQVVIPDRPGELARLFNAAGAAGINIEDVGIEHSPGLPAGVAELSVRPESVQRLTSALAAGGWPVRR